MLNYKADMQFNSRRSAIVGEKGMIATSQPLAVAAGLKILDSGGNAADAAIATAAALAVTEPTSTGIGGDCFALYFESGSKKVYALNGSGRSPKAQTLALVNSAGYSSQLPPFHPFTITVPGAAAGWYDLISRFGKLSFEAALAPAIQLAEDGFPVAPVTAYFWNRGVKRQLKDAPNGLELTINGRAPKPGEVFRNPGLSKTLKKIAEHGPTGFYQGEIAEAIVQVIQQSGGVMSLEDLAGHRSNWVDPISTTYHGYRIWECPPNGQGLAALVALNILEGLDIKDTQPFSSLRLHLMIEAMRIAFSDSRRFVADPETNPAPLVELLSKSYAASRRNLIDHKKASTEIKMGEPVSGSDTVYLTVVDKEGNACSFINSNYMGFGTGYVPKGWGFTLQNRGHGFSLDADHPNVLAPGKRPYHTIIPAIITHQDSGQLFASYGVMGGFMQPQGHMQVALNLIDDLQDPQQALDRPRFCITDGTSSGNIALEQGIDFQVMAELAQMGHRIIPTSGHGRAIFGRGQIILRDKDTGVLWGGSDPRADGLAMTLA